MATSNTSALVPALGMEFFGSSQGAGASRTQPALPSAVLPTLHMRKTLCASSGKLRMSAELLQEVPIFLSTIIRLRRPCASPPRLRLSEPPLRGLSRLSRTWRRPGPRSERTA